MKEKLQKQLEFILEADRLKQVYRQSLLTDGSREENDAEHSWHLALMAMVLFEHANEPDLDLLKIIKMLLVHDLVEIDAGDTYIYDEAGNATKNAREKAAAQRLYSLLPAEQEEELNSLWQEFEERKTKEAKFAAALDRFQPCLLNTRTNGHTWRKFGIRAEQVRERNSPIAESSEILWQALQEIIDEYMAKGILS